MVRHLDVLQQLEDLRKLHNAATAQEPGGAKNGGGGVSSHLPRGVSELVGGLSTGQAVALWAVALLLLFFVLPRLVRGVGGRRRRAGLRND
jgi:hypothetical protein